MAAFYCTFEYIYIYIYKSGLFFTPTFSKFLGWKRYIHLIVSSFSRCDKLSFFHYIFPSLPKNSFSLSSLFSFAHPYVPYKNLSGNSSWKLKIASEVEDSYYLISTVGYSDRPTN